MAIEALDRRHEDQLREISLKRGINDEQMLTLASLERFGWTLRFVRKSPLGPIAVVHDPEKHVLAVIEPDGNLNEDPPLSFRRAA